MNIQAPFANEGARPENADGAFLALLGNDGQLTLTLLYVVNSLALAALSENIAFCLVCRAHPPT
jgi:hypothetical protein